MNTTMSKETDERIRELLKANNQLVERARRAELACATLVMAYGEGESAGYIEWEVIDEAHILAQEALDQRFAHNKGSQ